MTREQQKQSLIRQYKSVLQGIQQTFVDISWWNYHTRKPDEVAIVTDQDGQLAILAEILGKNLRKLQSEETS